MTTPATATLRLTVDEFLKAYGGREDRFELIDGVPHMMAGANRRHVRITRNLLVALTRSLAGSPCEAMASDMGLEVSRDTYRLPDVAIYCDPRDVGALDHEPMTLKHPRVIFAILSRSTEAHDHGVKLDEYQGIASVDTIVFVHASRDAFTTFERAGANEWRSVVHLTGQPLVLRDPAVTLNADEIFAGTR
ncbi:MAG: Uma2 family endonuclease [Sphingomonadaceae bacterium]|nr:Uma2 family endonuclease [Sphingomonadaceae bacterium]